VSKKRQNLKENAAWSTKKFFDLRSVAAAAATVPKYPFYGQGERKIINLLRNFFFATLLLLTAPEINNGSGCVCKKSNKCTVQQKCHQIAKHSLLECMKLE